MDIKTYKKFWETLCRNNLTLIGLGIAIATVFIAICAPLLSSYNPIAVDIPQRLLPPSSLHFFGTDEMGRDIFTRVLFGCRISLLTGLSIVITAAFFGTLIGSISGYFGGNYSTIVMTFTDMLLSFPSMVLALALATALGTSLVNAVIAVAIVKIPVYIRLAHGQILSLKERPYVKAAKIFGASGSRIIFKHIIPNCLTPVLIQMSLGIGEAILTAAALSFIGLGAQPPTPELGAMISSARNFILDQWWYAALPGLAIFIIVVGFNLLGDGIRDILDPRSKS